MKKLILSVALIATTICEIAAQQPVQNFTNHPREFYQQNMFWFEANVNGTISRYKKGADSGATKWGYQMDLQYRRQADASFIKDGSYDNIFKQMYQNVYRPWIHYWAVPKKLRLSISPLGYWATWTPVAEAPANNGGVELNGKNNGVAPLFYHEYRTSLQLTFYYNLTKRWDFQQRYRLELRWVGKNQNSITSTPNSFLPTQDIFTDYDGTFTSASNKFRFRYQFRATYNLNDAKTKYITAWDELFIAMGSNTPTTKIFDQNRVIAMYGQKFNTARYPIEVQLGLTWVCQPKLNYNVPPTQASSYGSFNKSNYAEIFALQAYIILPEFHKFRKKEKPAATAEVAPVQK
jgi:hypothetical protein